MPATYTFNPTSTGRTGTIQSWTVPMSGTYKIEAWGASGTNVSTNNRIGGKGAYISGEIALLKDDVLKILVGQKGVTDDTDGAGGGGSFVVKVDASGQYSLPDGAGKFIPLIIAGGGGGASNNSNGVDASISTSGTPGTGTGAGAGGVDGSGGLGSGYGAGGAGLLTDGADSGWSSGSVKGGYAFVNGGYGGEGVSSIYVHGGFGGGGAAHGNSYIGGGGGGGYSGGSGSGSSGYGGGGGGSYNSGSNQVNTAGEYEGEGLVVITALQTTEVWKTISFNKAAFSIFNIDVNETYFLEYGTTASYGTVAEFGKPINSRDSLSIKIENLQEGQSYYYQVYSMNGTERTNVESSVFTTKRRSALFGETAITNITTDSAAASVEYKGLNIG